MGDRIADPECADGNGGEIERDQALRSDRPDEMVGQKKVKI